MTEDLRHAGNDEASAATLALLQIQADLQAAGTDCLQHCLPEPVPTAEQQQQQQDDPTTMYQQRGKEMIGTLNENQRLAADTILAAVAD